MGYNGIISYVKVSNDSNRLFNTFLSIKCLESQGMHSLLWAIVPDTITCSAVFSTVARIQSEN